MKKSIIYYEKENTGCLEWVELIKKHNDMIEFQPSSFCTEKIIYSEYKCIGFLFSSYNGKLPEGIEYIAKHLVADKESYYFAICSGGKREIKAIYTLENKLKERGMNLEYVYTEFMLQRISNDKDELVEKILLDIAEKNSMKEIVNERKEGINKKELHKEIKEIRKEYIKYLKEKNRKKKEKL